MIQYFMEFIGFVGLIAVPKNRSYQTQKNLKIEKKENRKNEEKRTFV